MIFHLNRLLATDSHEILSLIFRYLGKVLQNMSSVAVVIGALRVMMSRETFNKQHIYSVSIYVFS